MTTPGPTLNTGFLAQITPVILTFNEEPNVERTLAKLGAFREVVVVDSGSVDNTLSLLARFSNVRAVHRKFDNHSAQWNHAISGTGVTTEWVLALDADYVLTDAVLEEISRMSPADEVAGFRAMFRYCVWGKPLSATLYPPVVVLFRRARAAYAQDGHTQRVAVNGPVQELSAHILHDDRKSLGHWLWAQDRYAVLEVRALENKPWNALRWQDRLRKLIVVTPWLVPIYCLIVGRGLMDGRAGLYYALQRGVAEAILSLRLIESHLRK